MLMMEENKSKNYDDFDMIKLEGENATDGLFSPFTFIFFSLFIVLCGLVAIYSATFDLSVKNGLAHYSYLINQVYGLLAGIVVGLVLRFIPFRILKRSYYVLCPLAFVILIMMFYPSFNTDGVFTLLGTRIISGAVVATCAVISLISGAIPTIYEKRMEVPGVFFTLVLSCAMALAVLTALTTGMGYYFLIVLVVLIMLHASGAKKSFIVLAAIFSFATGIFMIVIQPVVLDDFFHSILPVSNPEYYNHDLFTSQLAIKDGGISGMGIGKGLYKLGVLSDVGGKFIFASITEEVGLVGILALYVSFLCLFFLGVMASRRAYKKKDNYLSGLSLGLAGFVFIAAIINGLYCAGLFPFGAVNLPFFSYGPGDEAMFIALNFVQYRIIYLMGRKHEII